MSKGIARFFLLVIILTCAFMYGYWNVPAVQNVVASITEEDFVEANIYSDLESLSARLDQEILNGSESFTVYLKDMDIDEIDGINKSLDGIYGNGSTYQQVGIIGKTYKKVTITIEKTINYYVLRAYLYHEPIPMDEVKARSLYSMVSTIMRSTIHASMTDYEKELALHDYLVRHCRYSDDIDQDVNSDIYRAYGALVNHDAVCNGYAEAMQLLLRCAGVQSEFVIGTACNSDGEWIDHAWNLVLLDGTWYHMDATWDDPVPDQGDEVLHTYFNVSDEVIGKNHQWEQRNYPKAKEMNYNYYKQTQTYFSDFSQYSADAYDVMVNTGKKRYEGVIENYEENDEDMQFIFEGNRLYNSVSWQTFQLGSYSVLVMDVS